MMKTLLLITACVLVGVPTDAAAKDECQWAAWRVGTCSKTCGSGTRFKGRGKLPLEEKEGVWKGCRKDDPSSGKDVEKENCNTNPCPQCELTSEFPFNTGCGRGETCIPNSNFINYKHKFNRNKVQYPDSNPGQCVKCKDSIFCRMDFGGMNKWNTWKDPWNKRSCGPDGWMGRNCPYMCGRCPGVCRYDNQCEENQICRERRNDSNYLGICVEKPCVVRPSSKKFGYLLGTENTDYESIDKVANMCKASCKHGSCNPSYCDNCHCCKE